MKKRLSASRAFRLFAAMTIASVVSATSPVRVSAGSEAASISPAMRTFTMVFHSIGTKYLEPVSAASLIDSAIDGIYAEAELMRPPGARQSPAPSSPVAPVTAEQLGQLTTAIRDVQTLAPRIEADRLWAAATRRMVTDLDPHSAYFDEREVASLSQGTNGLGGIGVVVAIRQGHLTIDHIFPGTPAEKFGLRPGDEIAEIEGQATPGLAMEAAVRLLRGEPGSDIRLLTRRADGSQPLTLTREVIRPPLFDCRLIAGRTLYLRPYSLANGLGQALERQLTQVSADKERAPRDLVLDLRNNAGGLLGEATRVVDLFLNAGEIAIMEGRNSSDEMQFMASAGDGSGAYSRLIVLVNEGTASGAELVAAALQDHRRAQIVGAATLGYGTVQTMYPLSPGGVLKLTTHRIRRPSGESLSAGVTPDVRLTENSEAASPQELAEVSCPGATPISGRLVRDAALGYALAGSR